MIKKQNKRTDREKIDEQLSMFGKPEKVKHQSNKQIAINRKAMKKCFNYLKTINLFKHYKSYEHYEKATGRI